MTYLLPIEIPVIFSLAITLGQLYSLIVLLVGL
jgi:hypothetical protein